MKNKVLPKKTVTKKPAKAKPITKVIKMGKKNLHIHNFKEKTTGADFSKMNWTNVEKYIDDKDFLNHYSKLIASSTPEDFYFTIIPKDTHILINFAPIEHYKKHKRPISVAFYIRHIVPGFCKFIPDAPPGLYEIETALLEEVENISEHMRNLGFKSDSEVNSNFKNLYGKDMEITDFVAKLILKHKSNDTLHKYVSHIAQPKDMYISIKDNYIYSVPKAIYDNFSQKQLKGLDSKILAKYKAREAEEGTQGYLPEYGPSEEQLDKVNGLERTFPEEYAHCLSYLGDSVYVVHSNMEEIKSGLLNAGYELKNIAFDVAKKWAKKEKLAKEIFDSYVPPVEHKHCEDDNCSGCDDHPVDNSSEGQEESNEIGYDKPLTFENFPESDFTGIHKFHLMGLFTNCKPEQFYAHATECNEGDKSFIFIVPKVYWDKHKKPFPYEMPLLSMMPTMVGSYKTIWVAEGSPFVINKVLNLVKFDVKNEEYNEFIENSELEDLLKVKELREIFDSQK